MRIELWFSPRAQQVLRLDLDLPQGARVRDALQLAAAHAEWRDAVACATQDDWALSLWSRRVGLDERLHDGDRLALSRPLQVDPKVARRERFRGQGSHTAGLFSKRRPGAKAGY